MCFLAACGPWCPCQRSHCGVGLCSLASGRSKLLSGRGHEARNWHYHHLSRSSPHTRISVPHPTMLPSRAVLIDCMTPLNHIVSSRCGFASTCHSYLCSVGFSVITPSRPSRSHDVIVFRAYCTYQCPRVTIQFGEDRSGPRELRKEVRGRTGVLRGARSPRGGCWA